MKLIIKTTAIISLSLFQISIYQSAMCAKNKKVEAKKLESSKELSNANNSVTITTKKQNISLEITGDTAYYNGKAVLLMMPQSNSKNNKSFAVLNLNHEMIAFIQEGAYINGVTYYQINYLTTNQQTYGGQYESLGEMVELLGQYVKDGKIAAESVAKIAKENKLKLTQNVAFQIPTVKTFTPRIKTATASVTPINQKQ
ncbi:MAG: hypothetical protein RL065_495 [Bacteroidota bacterium]|jgi:hypothetical protein